MQIGMSPNNRTPRSLRSAQLLPLMVKQELNDFRVGDLGIGGISSSRSASRRGARTLRPIRARAARRAASSGPEKRVVVQPSLVVLFDETVARCFEFGIGVRFEATCCEAQQAVLDRDQCAVIDEGPWQLVSSLTSSRSSKPSEISPAISISSSLPANVDNGW